MCTEIVAYLKKLNNNLAKMEQHHAIVVASDFVGGVSLTARLKRCRHPLKNKHLIVTNGLGSKKTTYIYYTHSSFKSPLRWKAKRYREFIRFFRRITPAE